jgi:hypothetical protein
MPAAASGVPGTAVPVLPSKAGNGADISGMAAVISEPDMSTSRNSAPPGPGGLRGPVADGLADLPGAPVLSPQAGHPIARGETAPGRNRPARRASC